MWAGAGLEEIGLVKFHESKVGQVHHRRNPRHLDHAQVSAHGHPHTYYWVVVGATAAGIRLRTATTATQSPAVHTHTLVRSASSSRLVRTVRQLRSVQIVR